MKDLTYKIIYTPSKESYYNVESTNINFLCSDGKIHIRLRDYDKEEIISGFINKLTYLITYLLNYVECSNKDMFLNEDEMIAYAENRINVYLYNSLKQILNIERFNGIKIFKNYRKLKNYSYLGNISTSLCPYSNGNDKCSLEFFLKTFKIDLYSFLFNDAYEIVITRNKDNKVYSKFINKRKTKNNNLNLDKRIDLW